MFTLYELIQINGIMPERALLRLKRAGIPLYNAQRVAKTQIRLRVRRRDLRKIAAIYPREGDIEKRGAYTFSTIEGVGFAKIVDFCKNRTGFLLGIMVFCILTLAADSFVFGIEFVGTDVYAREVAQTLNENGIRLFAPYKKGKEDMITAKLLTLDYVDFCSVAKRGGKIRVELRVSPFTAPLLSTGEMQAKHTGEILSITALRGTALKKAGESVCVGETLVADYFSLEGEGQVRVEPIARVKIACVYEGLHSTADSMQQAFAEAYLALQLTEKDEIVQTDITQIDDVFHVKINYVVIESMNL
jgi:hypothetical protein